MNQFPKLHNATWPGVVGKGPDSEPPIDLQTMLDLTAAASVHGTRFDGIDLALFEPHFNLDAPRDEWKRLAEQVQSRELVIGSLVAPVWPPTGGGSAMGDKQERSRFLSQVQKTCHVAQILSEIGIRPYGVVRIDSAADPETWSADPQQNTRRIADTFGQACDMAEDHGQQLAAEGEICWGGMHSWRNMLELLQLVERPQTLGFQADMAHTLLYMLGLNAVEDRILPEDFSWEDNNALQAGLRYMTDQLRPWTIDFHVAQNDATVKGAGSHDKTGRHCLPSDPHAKLDIARDSGHWLRDGKGTLTKRMRHICWDGCMFANETLLNPDTWNEILAAMISVREAHGWSENG